MLAEAFMVTDLKRSRTWHRCLLRLVPVLSGDDDQVGARVLGHPAWGWLMGLGEYSQTPIAETPIGSVSVIRRRHPLGLADATG